MYRYSNETSKKSDFLEEQMQLFTLAKMTFGTTNFSKGLLFLSI